MPTYINPTNRAVSVHFVENGKRSGGTVLPYTQKGRHPDGLYEVQMTAEKAKDYVTTGVLKLKPIEVPEPVTQETVVATVTSESVSTQEPEEIVIPTNVTVVITPDISVDVTTPDTPSATSEADRLDAIKKKRSDNMRRVAALAAEARERKKKAKESVVEDVPPAPERPPGRHTMEEKLEAGDEGEDSGDDIFDDEGDTTELPAPVAPEEAEKVAKEETVVIKNPIPSKKIPSKAKKFTPRLED